MLKGSASPGTPTATASMPSCWSSFARFLEAHLLQLHLPGGGAAGRAAVAPRSRRLDGAGPIQRFLRIALPMIRPTLFFLIVMNFVYGLLRDLRHRRRRHPGRPGRRDLHPGLQGLSGRLRDARPRLLGRAIRRTDDVRALLTFAAVPLRRAPRELQRLGRR